MRTERTIPSLNLFPGSCREVLKLARYCLAVLLLLTIPALAQIHNRNEICVKVDKVGESPGFWSGIVASTQLLDATVIASSSKGYKIGDKISFGIYVVHGDRFADSQTPRLNPRIIFAGAVLTLGTKDGCRVEGHTDWVYSCVKIGCSKRASGDHIASGHADPPNQQ
jgi:hypothetical protein